MANEQHVAFEKFLSALFILRDILGPEKTSDVLEHELHREKVLARIKEERRAGAGNRAAGGAAQGAEPNEVILAAALEFYADPDNWKGGTVSAVFKDKGKTARDALDLIVANDDGSEG